MIGIHPLRKTILKVVQRKADQLPGDEEGGHKIQQKGDVTDPCFKDDIQKLQPKQGELDSKYGDDPADLIIHVSEEAVIEICWRAFNYPSQQGMDEPHSHLVEEKSEYDRDGEVDPIRGR